MSTHLVKTEAGLRIHKSVEVPELGDRELDEPECAFIASKKLISRRTVAAVVGPDAAVQVGRIDHSELFFGVHWQWISEQLFTAAGVQLLVDRLAETHGGAALALRAYARQFYQEPVAEIRASSRLRANGYMPEEDAAA